VKASLLICRSDTERRRFLDLRMRLRHVSPSVIALYLTAGLVGVPAYGWLPLAPAVVLAASFGVVWVRMAHMEHGDLALAMCWLLGELALTASIALASGAHGYQLSLLVMPTALVAVIFPSRVMPLVIGITFALAIGVAFLCDAAEVERMPPVLFLPLGIILILAVTLAAIRDLDIATRRSAVVDQLTGVLNRSALVSRATELAHHASRTGAQVAVIAADIDHFKPINDNLGHAAGDAVLCEVAQRLSRCVEADESLYRHGGDEFVVLLAGADRRAAERTAERMRRVVRSEPIAGLSLTMSFGVSASVAGQPFDFDASFERADAALYEAKLDGRDQVRGAIAPAEHPVAPTPLTARRAGAAADDEAGIVARGARVRTRRTDEDPALDGEPESAQTVVARAGARHAPTSEDAGSVLVANGLERAHMLDLNARLRTIFVRCAALAFIGIIASGAWVGWAILPAPILGAAFYHLVQRHIERFRRPEYLLVGSWLVFQFAIAIGFSRAHHAPLFALPLLVLMVPGMSAIFPRRGVIIGTAFTALVIVGTGLYLDANAVAANPAVVAFPLALLGTISLIGSTVGRSAFSHRGASVVDPLTGMLNRGALQTRLAELAARIELTGEEVAVVIGDVDRFKDVNDNHGHAVGDSVLETIAARMRGSLRTFESAYRIGGEEFAIVLNGTEAREAGDVAERLRQALRHEPVNGLSVTMSFGVAALDAGERFDEEALFTRADAALYRAKAGGRDRVCVHGGDGDGVTAVA